MEETTPKRKTDRRIAKTKRAICNAFTELLSTKGLNAITIKDIAELADVNRKTIYNYYAGVHEILDEIENRLVATFEKFIANVDIRNPYNIFERLTSVLNSNLDFYGKLLRINSNTNLGNKLINSLKQRLKQICIEQHLVQTDKIDLVLNYIVSGLFASYQLWFNSGREIPLTEFSRDVSKLVYDGVNAYLIK